MLKRIQNFGISAKTKAEWDSMDPKDRDPNLLYLVTPSMFVFNKIVCQFINESGGKHMVDHEFAQGQIPSVELLTRLASIAATTDSLWYLGDVYIGHSLEEITDNIVPITQDRNVFSSRSRTNVDIKFGPFETRRIKQGRFTPSSDIPYPVQDWLKVYKWAYAADGVEVNWNDPFLVDTSLSPIYGPNTFHDGLVYASADLKTAKILVNGQWYNVPYLTRILKNKGLSYLSNTTVGFVIFQDTFKYASSDKLFNLSDGYVLLVYLESNTNKWRYAAYNVVTDSIDHTEITSSTIYYTAMRSALPLSSYLYWGGKQNSTTPEFFRVAYENATTHGNNNLTSTSYYKDLPKENLFFRIDRAKNIAYAFKLKDYFSFGYKDPKETFYKKSCASNASWPSSPTAIGNWEEFSQPYSPFM